MFKSVAQGVLEIFEEVSLVGGGGGAHKSRKYCTGRQAVNFSSRRQPGACTSLDIPDLKHGFD